MNSTPSPCFRVTTRVRFVIGGHVQVVGSPSRGEAAGHPPALRLHLQDLVRGVARHVETEPVMGGLDPGGGAGGLVVPGGTGSAGSPWAGWAPWAGARRGRRAPGAPPGSWKPRSVRDREGALLSGPQEEAAGDLHLGPGRSPRAGRPSCRRNSGGAPPGGSGSHGAWCRSRSGPAPPSPGEDHRDGGRDHLPVEVEVGHRHEAPVGGDAQAGGEAAQVQGPSQEAPRPASTFQSFPSGRPWPVVM
jgi:hypothetical protein